MAPVCTTTWGEGNDSWEQGTDNLMFPWKPDYANDKPCGHNDEGQFVMMDHTSPSWAILDGVKANHYTTAHFDQLQAVFDNALTYMETNEPERVAVWGFVSHLSEFSKNSSVPAGPHQEALTSLDAFLTEVDTQVAEDKVMYGTPVAIAKEIYPEVF